MQRWSQIWAPPEDAHHIENRPHTQNHPEHGRLHHAGCNQVSGWQERTGWHILRRNVSPWPESPSGNEEDCWIFLVYVCVVGGGGTVVYSDSLCNPAPSAPPSDCSQLPHSFHRIFNHSLNCSHRFSAPITLTPFLSADDLFLTSFLTFSPVGAAGEPAVSAAGGAGGAGGNYPTELAAGHCQLC
jgi:hypothetical protein